MQEWRSIRVFLLLFIAFCPALAQTYSFNTYTVQDGLAQSNVLGIVQDRNGYLWLGTESGVSRFDGKNFRNYTTDDGLADNNISSMLLDQDGNIWFGHGISTVTRYDGKTFTAVNNPGFPAGKNVYTMFQDREGKIWFSFIPYGLVVLKNPKGNLNDSTNYIKYQDKDLSEQVYSICQDNDGMMWFHTRYGIKYLNPQTGKFEYYQSSELSGTPVTAFYIDKKGVFWLGQSQGRIKKFDKQEKRMTAYTEANGLPEPNASEGGFGNFVNTIFEDGKGDIWFATWDRGVSRLNSREKDETRLFTNFSSSNGLPINKIRCISEDREGNILLGTFGNGLSVFKGERFISFGVKDGLINNQVWGILQDTENRYWFITNEGLSIFDPSAGKTGSFQNIKNIESAPSSSIRTITMDKDGNVWLGTWGSKLIRYDKSKKRFQRDLPLNEVVFNHISVVKADSKNRIWVGSPVGLTVLDQSSGQIRSFSTIDGLSENDVTAIFEDKSGTIWIGTKQKGLNKYDGNKFTSYGKEQGLTNGNISSITESENGKIWIGTAGGGLFLFENNKFTNYKIRDGLTSDYVTLVLADDKKNIWVGTNNGLSKYDPKAGSFTSYGKMEGFTGVETKSNACFMDNNKHLWFGSANGAFRFNSGLDKPNPYGPLTMLTGLRINNVLVEPSQQLSLSYKENSLTFDFIGISLTNPEAVRYAVMLEGYDETWKPLTNQNSEEYSNLPPGEYTFRLKAYNNSGVESEEPVTVSFAISPPVWKTWWFYVLVIVTGVTLLFAYIKIRERALIQEKKVLEAKVQERTAEVVEKNRELAEKNKDIMDSIHYAKRIQQVILPPDEFVRKFLPQTFILFKPKDIVSGDFYWLADKGDKVLFAAVDCTGHGVPGAFMSIVGHNMLEAIVNEHNITQPSGILEALNKSVSDTLRQSYMDDNQVKDGMEAAVCMFNRNTKEFQFSGSMNPLYFVRNGELKEIKGDKHPIGNLRIGEERRYTNHSIMLEKGDTLYIFSDGYADQFGGPAGKKFKYQQLKDVIMKIQEMDMEAQGAYLDKTIVDWMGHLDQVDDILIIGTRL